MLMLCYAVMISLCVGMLQTIASVLGQYDSALARQECNMHVCPQRLSFALQFVSCRSTLINTLQGFLEWTTKCAAGELTDTTACPAGSLSTTCWFKQI